MGITTKGNGRVVFGPRTSIVTDGLVFYIDPANPESYVSPSTTTNSLVGGLTGSLINGTGFLTENNGVWDFDGLDDGIDIGTIVPDTGLTFNIWIKIGGALGSRNYGNIISNWLNSPNSASHWWIGTHINNPDDIQVYFNGGLRFTILNQPLQTWRLLTITHNGTNIIAYINGTETNTGTSTLLPYTSLGVTSLGFDVNRNNYPFLGNIGVVQIYNRALTPEETLENYNALKGRFGL